ncbi:hypothetical protein ABW20_dc0110024 [Dactylellina cionopaga]|nr:hypothetical protein ABW20_dc0110024 [Dactylellina cionopaga]
MFFLKSLVTGLALGLVQDALATASCCTNQCGKSVKLAKYGKKDCSAVLIKTVCPTRTTTLYRTTTRTIQSISTKVVANSVVVTVTSIVSKISHTDSTSLVTSIVPETDYSVSTLLATSTLSETDYSVSTSLATVDETQYSTDISTVTETAFSTVTIPYVIPTTSATVVKRDSKPSPKPGYASACDSGAYTRACSCLGIKPTTITQAAVKKTVWKTRTATKTVKTTKTSLAPAKTSTKVVSLTTVTTIVSGTTIVEAQTSTVTTIVSGTEIVDIQTATVTTVVSGTEIVETQTVTLTVSATTTATDIAVVTQTADPAPPTCTGTGFILALNAPDTTVNGQFLGFIDSIGVGIYLRAFSGGGSPMSLDANGNIQNWYPGSDLNMVVKSGAAPYKVWFQSSAENVNYSYPTESVSCQLGDGPDYKISCKGPGGGAYTPTICQDPVYYEWVLWIYNDPSQLVGLNCAAGGSVIKAICKH